MVPVGATVGSFDWLVMTFKSIVPGRTSIAKRSACMSKVYR